MAQAEQINPGMLTWAREAAGLSVEEAAEKFGLKGSAKATAAEKLRALTEVSTKHMIRDIIFDVER